MIRAVKIDPFFRTVEEVWITSKDDIEHHKFNYLNAPMKSFSLRGEVFHGKQCVVSVVSLVDLQTEIVWNVPDLRNEESSQAQA